MWLRKDSALDKEDEDAAATTVCLIPVTPRVVGSTSRSLVLETYQHIILPQNFMVGFEQCGCNATSGKDAPANDFWRGHDSL